MYLLMLISILCHAQNFEIYTMCESAPVSRGTSYWEGHPAGTQRETKRDSEKTVDNSVPLLKFIDETCEITHDSKDVTAAKRQFNTWVAEIDEAWVPET
jgi:hypothetical protein